MAAMGAVSPYDRAAALKEFDESKAGVKGLVDSGATTIPPFFYHPNPHPIRPPSSNLSIPTIDLSIPRSLAIDLIHAAAKDWGFFQVTNHGVPNAILDDALSSVRSFHELSFDVRSRHYSREFIGGVSYASNYDLFRSAAASWRDTVQIKMAPISPDLDRIPAICRDEMVRFDEHVTGVARWVMGLMSEGLGVESGKMEGLTCLEGRMMVCHYYPWCPQPDRTMGIVDHTDPGVLTVLVQDSTGGLLVKRDGEDGEGLWVDVQPVPGALVINVGDLLQIITNDEYKSVEHRVMANQHEEARVSIAALFTPGKNEETDFYGPLSELVSPEKQAHYPNFSMPEFLGAFAKKQLGSKCLVDHFKLTLEK